MSQIETVYAAILNERDIIIPATTMLRARNIMDKILQQLYIEGRLPGKVRRVGGAAFLVAHSFIFLSTFDDLDRKSRGRNVIILEVGVCCRLRHKR